MTTQYAIVGAITILPQMKNEPLPIIKLFMTLLFSFFGSNEGPTNFHVIVVP